MTDSSRCPSPEQIAAFVAGSLFGEELMMVMEHVQTCNDCRLVLTDAAMIDREPKFAETAASPARLNLSAAWLAAAAAVVLITVAVLLVRARVPGPNDAMHRLVAAAPRDGRYLEPRLSGDFAWAPILPTRRGANQPLDPREMKLIGAAGEVLEKTANDPAPAAQHAAALAHLLAGRPAEAVPLLTKLAVSSKNADLWSDLAAAHYAAGVQSDQAQQFGQALAAADTALQFNPRLPAALFNRALAIERLGLRDRAVAAWEQSLAIDGGSPWAAEARNHLQRLRGHSSFRDELERHYARLTVDEPLARDLAKRFPEDARRWGETEILGRWAEALLKGNDREADGHLALARVFGDEVSAGGGDCMLRDAVAAVGRSTPELRRAIGETQLAFREAQLRYKAHEPKEALLLFEQAADGFSRGGSPLSLLARYYAANTFYDCGDKAESRRRIEELLATSPPQYPAHRADLQWQMGMLESAAGEWGRAITAFGESVRGYDRLDERHNSAVVRHILSEVYDRIGDSQTAWTQRVMAWQELGRTEDLRLQSAVQTAARAAALEGQWRVSLAFLDLAVGMPPAYGTELLRYETLLFRARVRERLGQNGGAASDLARAAGALQQIRDADTHELAEADALAVAGFLAPSPFAAVPNFTRAIEYHRTKGRHMYLPELYLERGRAYAKMREAPAAAADFDAGIGELENQRLSLRAGDQRWGMFSSYGELFDEAVALALARGDVEQAFAYSERARARELLDSLGADGHVVAAATSTALPSAADVVIIEYATLPESLVMFVIDRQKLHVIQTSVPRATLLRDAELLAGSAMSDDATRFRGAASTLYDRLLQPAAGALRDGQRLVIIPDAALGTVPFAALLDPAGKYVIERYSVVIAPSAAAFARLESRPQPAPREPRLLLISGPAGREGDVSQLTSAQREADAVMAIYHHAPDVVSDGRDTTTFETRAENADVIHFVGHAELPGEGLGGALLTGGGALDVRRIASLRLRRARVVILAACGTARGGEESISIARAFLAAGAPSVVATLWPINDDAAAEFFPRLHHYLADGLSPADAVRATQLEWIRERNAPPGLWAAVQTIGS
jgi:CHAT domain-containing protein/tetratricopeptide (TPR) repeat protein